MLEVKFYDTVEDAAIRFAVILASYQGKWVLCRHRARDTWELPGGHREPGETPMQTAARELYEETGARDGYLGPVCAYSVTGKNRVNATGEETFGMLYYSHVSKFDELPASEIAEIRLFDVLPDALTYPDIQPKLLQEALRRGFPK